LRTHIHTIRLSELASLCFELKVDSIEELIRIMWSMIQQKRRNKQIGKTKELPIEA
jgi:hypothetical protein